jgi:DNA-binding transcriptional regulator YhcF (GntR family)
MGMVVSKQEKETRLRRNEEKWTPTLMDAGWTVLPSVILERQQALGLDPIDINIILHIARHWWYADKPPYPSKRTIAECMGIDESTVRKHIARMENDGLLKRNPRYDPKFGGQRSNEYLFNGLIKEALPFAEEAIQQREVRRKEDAEKRTRKRPKLRVVRDDGQEEK